jgi:mRNA-degrading endonuclease RelE of RelBE toxin-antitoxin system
MDLCLTYTAKNKLKKIHPEERKKLIRAISYLADEARPLGYRKMRGYGIVHYRIKIGSCRIIYRIEASHLLVLCVEVGHRDSLYEEKSPK